MDLSESKIIIEKTIQIAENHSNGNVFQVRKMKIIRNRLKQLLDSIRGGNTLETTRIFIDSDSGMYEVQLAEKMHVILTQQIRSKLTANFDCNAFAHRMNDVPQKWPHIDFNKWNVKILGQEEAKVGETVFLANTENPLVFNAKDITHFSIYLGHQLYISKFGSTGPLITTTLDEMIKGFGGNHVYRCIPK